MIQEDVRSVLSPVFAARFYPAGTVPDGAARPFGAYQVISHVPDAVLSGSGTKTQSRIQVDVYADTYAAAWSTIAAVKAAMIAASFPNVLLNVTETFEDDTALHRVSADYSIRHD